MLLLFDEVQKASDWENKIKTVYDLYKGHAKIYLSGSESLFILKKSKETLAGRLFEFKVEPLYFKEFLNFKGINLKPVGLYEKELERLTRSFTQMLSPNIGPEIDVPAPDVNTNSKIMDWMAEEFKIQSSGFQSKCCCLN